MKRNISILISIVMLFAANVARGQQLKDKVAIYTIDDSGMDYIGFVGDFLTNAIVKQGQYVAVERTAQFLAELNKEQSFQRTGAVDDSQISQLGKNMGVQFVCVAKVGRIGEQLYVSARLVDVESAAMRATARPVRFDPDNLDEIDKACIDVVNSLFGGAPRHAASGPTYSNPSSMGRSHAGEPEMVFVEGGTFIMGCMSHRIIW